MLKNGKWSHAHKIKIQRRSETLYTDKWYWFCDNRWSMDLKMTEYCVTRNEMSEAVNKTVWII